MELKSNILGWRSVAALIITGCFCAPSGAVAQEIGSHRFVRRTDLPFTQIDSESYASSWGDFDGNGFPDLFIGRGDSETDLGGVLFANRGDGTFVQRHGAVTDVKLGGIYSGTWSDFNNDGVLDLFVSGLASQAFLLLGGADFTIFDEQTFSTGFTPRPTRTYDSSPADFDQDGWLDVLIASQDEVVLYRNRGDGRFEPISFGLSGARSFGTGLWQDFDRDGDPDLFFARGRRVVRNDGHGFTDTTEASGIAPSPDLGGSAAWGDINNDLLPDLCVVSMADFHIYTNDGDGAFEEATPPALTGVRGSGCSFADVNNDGFMDLFVTHPETAVTNRLYLNDGSGDFLLQASEPFASDSSRSLGGATWVDFDRDGDLDLFVPNTDDPATWRDFFYENVGPKGRWLRVELEGRHSNRAAIGAKVAVVTRGRSFQTREVSGKSTLYSQDDLGLHFGLGNARTAELRVEWPSGLVEHRLVRRLDRTLRIRERKSIRKVQLCDVVFPRCLGKQVTLNCDRQVQRLSFGSCRALDDIAACVLDPFWGTSLCRLDCVKKGIPAGALCDGDRLVTCEAAAGVAEQDCASISADHTCLDASPSRPARCGVDCSALGVPEGTSICETPTTVLRCAEAGVSRTDCGALGLVCGERFPGRASCLPAGFPR